MACVGAFVDSISGLIPPIAFTKPQAPRPLPPAPAIPIPAPDSQALYKQYEAEAAKLDSVSFIGRRGTYKYYNMDQVVGAALSFVKKMNPPAAEEMEDGS